MKKKITITLVLIITIITIYNIKKLLTTKHNINYDVNKYKVLESYHKNKSHFYDIIIKNNKYTVSYTLNKDLSKKKKIIKNIKMYKSNNLICLLPIYKKDIESNLYCVLDNQQVSNYYLEQTSNNDYQKLLKEAKIKSRKTKTNKTNYKKLDIYQTNISNNHKYIIWDYKGIYIIDRENDNYQKILDYDLYDNIMATIVDNYFVLFENTSVAGIKKIYYYDLEKEKLKSFKPKIVLSKNSYINGTFNNEIYVTDLKEKKEYKINIRKEKIEEVDEDQTNYYIYEDNKKINLSKSDYFLKKKFFNNKLLSNKNITKSKELKKEYNYYYYYENNNFYKVLDNNFNNSILLFNLEDIKDWYIVDREVILIKDGTIYHYDDKSGLNEIISSNELKYNYENIYYLWKN